MLRLRLIYGLSLAGLIIVLLVLDGWLSGLSPTRWPFGQEPGLWGRWLFNGGIATAISLVLTWMAARELVLFARQRGFAPLGKVAQVFAAGLVLGPYLAHNLGTDQALRGDGWGMLWLALGLGVSFLLQAIRRGTANVMANLACTLFIIFYAGGLAGFLVKLRMDIGGMSGIAVLLSSLLVVKFTDVGAFFIGSWTGRHKMIPWLSPKKTWEGLAGGIATAMLVAAICLWLLERNGVTAGPMWIPLPGRIALFGGLMALFSVAGDLCASLLKRDAAVKDSGDALPGLGGILDVLDSPLLAAPVAWFFWAGLPVESFS